MSEEFHCCHGTPETGHRPSCPYDKNWWGADGVRVARWGNCHVVIDFHQQGLQHGPGSKFAKNLEEQAHRRAETP